MFLFSWLIKNFSGNNFFEGSKVKEALNTNGTPWQTVQSTIRILELIYPRFKEIIFLSHPSCINHSFE